MVTYYLNKYLSIVTFPLKHYTLNLIDVHTLAISATNLFASNWSHNVGVYLSTDSGISWQQVNNGLPNYAVWAFAVNGANIFAAMPGAVSIGGGIYLSTNNGSSWIRVNNGLTNTNVLSLAASPDGKGGTNIFAGTDIGGVFLSTNNGTSWEQVNNGLSNKMVLALAVCPNGIGGTNIFAGTNGSGVYLSTNDGSSWTLVNTGLTDLAVSSLVISGNNIFASTFNSGIYISTNNGSSWMQVNDGLINTKIRTLAIYTDMEGKTNIYAGTDNNGVWKRTLYDFPPYTKLPQMINDVKSENNSSQDSSFTQSFNNKNGTLVWVYGTFKKNIGVDGIVTAHINVGNLVVDTQFVVRHNYRYKLITYYDISLFVGNEYFNIRETFPETSSDTSNYFTGQVLTIPCNCPPLYRHDVYYYPTGIDSVIFVLYDSTATGIENIYNNSQSKFSLQQNYPNPFNPITIINYVVPKESFVTIKAFDILGREVATLVNENKLSGSYSVNFDGVNLSSGVYFYRMQAGSFVETKKLLLLK